MGDAKLRWLYIAAMVCLTNLSTGDELLYQPKIIVVGAGPSGIAAASKLFEHGFRNITILEAENRIGGRIHTTWFDESWVDLGAHWVHGDTDNVVFDLAAPLGLLHNQISKTMSFAWVFNSKGDRIPASITGNFLDLIIDTNNRSPRELKSYNGSAGSYFTRMMTTFGAEFPGANETLIKQFTEVYEGLRCVWDGGDNWYDTSARLHVEYEPCPGNALIDWKDRGFGTILEILMKKYPNPENELPVMNNTLLNTEVISINYTSTEGKVLVISNDGRKHEADHVIVTPSLGVLKEGYKTLFTPQLPAYKVKTIKGLGMGSVAKIYLFFESPWWPEEVFNFLFAWNDSDRHEYKNDPDKKWLLDVIGFFMLAHRPRLLKFWVVGSGARHMETLPEGQVLNQTFELLNKFVGRQYNIPRPTGMIRSQWYTNKHFRGTYSFRSMETEKAGVWADDLATPLLVNGKPIVMFAGEATSPHHFKTVHGAVETGFREANRLRDLYKKTPN